MLFEDATPPLPREVAKARAKAERAQTRSEKAEERGSARLREELGQTKASLQSIIEEQETTNEELRSANEEILSSNEELQSANEELESGKEELQSTNEELTTLNEELQNRNVELASLNGDLNNLFATVNIPIIMVGSDLRIRRFTPIAEKLFNFIASDIGRPIGNLRPTIEVPGLEKLVQGAIQTVSLREVEVQDKEGRWYSLRVRPYRTVDNKLEGAVLMLLDIDALKTEVTESRMYAASTVETVQTALVVLDANFTVRTANRAFFEVFKASPEETIGQFIYDLGNGQWDIPRLRELLGEILPKMNFITNFKVEHEFPQIGRKTMLLNARAIREKRNNLQLILLSIEDITARQEAEEALRASEERFRLLVEGVPDYAIYMIDPEGRVVSWNQGAERIMGYRAEEIVGKPHSGFFLEEDAERGLPDELLKAAISKGRAESEGWRVRKDGTRFWTNVTLAPLRDSGGNLLGFAKVTRDFTAQMQDVREAVRVVTGCPGRDRRGWAHHAG